MTPNGRQDLAAVIEAEARRRAADYYDRGGRDDGEAQAMNDLADWVAALLLAEARVETMGDSTDNPTASVNETKEATVSLNQVSRAKRLPTTKELSGSEPTITNGLSTDEYIRSSRGDGGALAKAVKHLTEAYRKYDRACEASFGCSAAAIDHAGRAGREQNTLMDAVRSVIQTSDGTSPAPTPVTPTEDQT